MSGGYGALVGPGLTFAGPDQGIDFTGKGAIFAPGKLKITRVDLHSGWPGGHIIVGKLLDGPHAGRYVYFAEALNPVAGLKPGTVVEKGTTIATLNSSYPGTEVGWAKDARGTAYGTTRDGKPGGPTPWFGKDFLAFITGTPSPLGIEQAIHSGPDESLGQTLTHPEFLDTAAGEAGKIAGDVISGLVDAFTSTFGKAFLYFVFVAAGVGLLVAGVARATGVGAGKPATA